jgi:hypothetical protein
MPSKEEGTFKVTDGTELYTKTWKVRHPLHAHDQCQLTRLQTDGPPRGVIIFIHGFRSVFPVTCCYTSDSKTRFGKTKLTHHTATTATPTTSCSPRWHQSHTRCKSMPLTSADGASQSRNQQTAAPQALRPWYSLTSMPLSCTRSRNMPSYRLSS